MLCACLLNAPARSGHPYEPVSDPIDTMQIVGGADVTQVGTGGCVADADCDDGSGCTQDVCTGGTCVNAEIPGCVPCEPGYTCVPVEIVFIMDTSGSMRDEAIALCAQIDDIVAQLEAVVGKVSSRILGIMNTGDLSFTCVETDVVALLGPDVPGALDTCVFPDGDSSFESWGPATAIVADRYPWTSGATHIVVPIADEGPCNGTRPDGCNDPGDDRNSVTNAANIAVDAGVIVSPLTGSGSDGCMIALAESLATQTGGIAIHTEDASTDIANAIVEIVLATCDPDPSCDDGSVCTDGDTCIGGQCIGAPNFDDATFCCQPETAELTLIDDSDVCTDDYCDPVTGIALHSPSAHGTTCDDGDVCTSDDVCDGAGSCIGTDLNELFCTGDDDCFGANCDTETGFCVCTPIPELCLSALDPRSDASCYTVGETVVIDIVLGFSTNVIAGAGLFFQYNPSILAFESIIPGALADPSSPYELVLFRDIDEINGTVLYAVGINLGGYGTQGPATLARVRFTALAACQTDELCWIDSNPKRTTLSNMQGQVVPFEACCSGPVFINTEQPMFTCPESLVLNADPGSAGSTLVWDAPAASSDCLEGMQVSCTASHSEGWDIDHLIEGGGLFPPGVSNFACTAVDSCGATAMCEWSIEVEPTIIVEVDLELSPTMASGEDGTTLDRCIEFELFSNCTVEPVRVQQEVSFGPPFNLQGQAVGVLLEVPPGDYRCITARDPLHTLKSVADPVIVDNRYMVSFLGDPIFGGNWLVSGNLDGSSAIDVVDFGIFVDYYMTQQAADTPCDEVGVNADFNGDAFVDGRDWQFISDHLEMTDMTSCCDTTTATTAGEVVLEISIEELVARGLGRLIVADLNNDGLLNQEDIELFRANGLSPQSWLKGFRGARSLRNTRGGGTSK